MTLLEYLYLEATVFKNYKSSNVTHPSEEETEENNIAGYENKMTDQIKAAALEAFPVHIMYGGGEPQRDVNEELRSAFIKGFEFRQWLNDVSMTGPEVPLHIKYRMYKNQKEAKDKIKWEKFNDLK